jgi:hypothetical protein
MLAYYNKEIDAFNLNMKALVNFHMNEGMMLDWFRSLFPVPRSDSKRSNSILENNTATFLNLLESGKGTDIPSLRGSGWHCLNALTEYVNHNRSTRIKGDRDKSEVKFESVVFGDGNNLMQVGMKKLLVLAKTEPSAPIRVN